MSCDKFTRNENHSKVKKSNLIKTTYVCLFMCTSVNPVHNAPCQSPHPVLRISHSGSKRWGTFLGIKISCNQWKAQGCTQGALLLFLLNFGRRGRGGVGGEGFFSFFFGSQCVPQHNITMCYFSLPPRTPPPPPPPFHEKNKNHEQMLHREWAVTGRIFQALPNFCPHRQTRPRRHVEHENHTLFTRIQNISSRTDLLN